VLRSHPQLKNGLIKAHGKLSEYCIHDKLDEALFFAGQHVSLHSLSVVLSSEQWTSVFRMKLSRMIPA
jgi:hypothetical protein